MSSGTRGSRALAASLVCGIARPAFADGAIPTEHELYVFFLKVGLVALAIVVAFVGLLRWALPAVLGGRADCSSACS